MKDVIVVSGNIPAIISCNLVDNLDLNEDTIVLIEHEKADEQDKILINNIILNTIKCEKHYFELPPTISRLIYRDPFYYKKEIKKIKKQIKQIINENEIENVFYSSNAFLQNMFRSSECNKIQFEHGVKDYINLKTNNSFYAIFRDLYKKAVELYLNIPIFRNKQKIILCDNYQCKSTNYNYRKNNNIVTLPSPDIKYLANNLIRSLEVNRSLELQQCIQNIKILAADKDEIYLYLPTESVPFDQYHSFLVAQLNNLKPINPLFIIKPHPADHNKYSNIFSNIGVKCIEPGLNIWRYIPAEFIGIYIDQIYFIGNSSSSIFYAFWWLNRKSRNVDGNYDNSMIRNISKNFKKDNDLMGLL
jgi:hypothetical protein